jgi:hypothetical protein
MIQRQRCVPSPFWCFRSCLPCPEPRLPRSRYRRVFVIFRRPRRSAVRGR